MIDKKVEMKNTNWALLAIFLLLAYEWVTAGWEKVSGGEFVANLPKTLGFFASKNPYPWFKDFLLTTAVPNADLFGNLVMWGELTAGITIAIGVGLLFWQKKEYLKTGLIILKIGLFGGAFLSLIFYLAAGWTSPSTEGLNLVMLVIQAIGIVWVARQIAW